MTDTGHTITRIQGNGVSMSVCYLECREKEKGNGDESKKEKQKEETSDNRESSENQEESSKETKQEEVKLLHGTVFPNNAL